MSTPRGFVGMYDFKESLGKGHFSVVKVAEHVISKQRVAVKIIEKCKLTQKEREEMFHEVRVMKLLRHPHVIRLYQVVDTTSRLYLILELGNGGDLYEHINKHGPIPEPRAKDVMRQIIDGVLYCHRHNIAHRDLKPENVVFCKAADGETDIVKVTDFGLSNQFNPGEMMKTMCGSLCYSAPEVLLQDPYDGPTADIWSLGVILYMVVVGRLPFYEHSDAATLVKILDVSYEVPKEVSEGCKELMSRMIIRDAEKRMKLPAVRQHQWMADENTPTMASTHTDNHDFVKLSPQDHERILDIMEKADIPKEDVKKALDANTYDYVSSTYYLLAEQQMRARRLRQTQRLGPSPGKRVDKSLHRHNTVTLTGMKQIGGDTGKFKPHDTDDDDNEENGDLPVTVSESPSHRIKATGRHTGSLFFRQRSSDDLRG